MEELSNNSRAYDRLARENTRLEKEVKLKQNELNSLTSQVNRAKQQALATLETYRQSIKKASKEYENAIFTIERATAKLENKANKE